MTITEQEATTVADVLDAVEHLSPTIAARAPEIEAARRLPSDLVDALVEAGCFRLLIPASNGGLGAALPDVGPVLEALARADGSTGWTVMIGAGSWIDTVGLPRPTFDMVLNGDPKVILAGVFNPSGSITAVDGGYRVTGRWSFASGCEHATWIWANSVEGMVDGIPQLRGALFEPDQVRIEDTWSVSGLSGTGSHHFSVTDAFVPADRTWDPLAGEPCIDDPIVRVSPPSAFALAIATVAIGIAQGAVDEVCELATTKVPLLTQGSLAATSVFQHDLAVADTQLRAARALLYETAEDVWRTAVAGDEPTLELRARTRAAAVWVTDQAAAVVDIAYHSGGGSSIYQESPLQRRLRDIHALTQHFLVRPDTLVTAGAILAGQDVEVMVF